MNPGYRFASLCLAFTVAAGLVPLPDPSFWVPAQPEPPPITTPEPPADTSPEPPSLPTGDGLEDVSSTDWFYPAIRVGVRHGFIRPVEGRFEPQQSINRAAFVSMLGRMHMALGGVVRHDHVPNLPYTDIVPHAEYLPYLAWATATEIVRGDAEQRFRPDAPITREEMAVLLARYIDAYVTHDHVPTDYYDDHNPYADWWDIAEWAHDEVHLLRALGVLQGREVEPGIYLFHPGDYVLRLESAVVLVRLFEMIFEERGAL